MDLLSPGLFGQKEMVFEEHHLASVMGNVGVEVLSMHCVVLLMELASRNAVDTAIPTIIEADETSPAKRTAWARLIQKIYAVDPLTCPKCKGAMKTISFIEQPEIIKAILRHVGLWKKGKPAAA